jgi:diacylglycerol kinase (ATP)
MDFFSPKTLSFQARESPFYLISSRIINKLIYFSYGTKDVLERQCQNLNQHLRLYMDGTLIELPNIGNYFTLQKQNTRAH